MQRHGLLAGLAAAALAGIGGQFAAGAVGLNALSNAIGDLPPSLSNIAYGPGGHTQGSSRDVDHERHLNRLARHARRQTRRHAHSATGRKALLRASHTMKGGYVMPMRQGRYATP